MGLELVAYALIAALSPVGFAATLAVLESGRLKALAFGVAFVAAQLGACAALVGLGSVTIPGRGHDHATARAFVETAFGVGLLVLAAAVHGSTREVGAPSGDRAARVLDRLRRLRVVTALAAGVLLGIGGPKRLVLTALAASSIAASGVQGSQRALLVVGYAVVASVLVWAPIAAFELAGDGVVARLRRLQDWLGRHRRGATSAALVLIGVFATVDGIAALLA